LAKSPKPIQIDQTSNKDSSSHEEEGPTSETQLDSELISLTEIPTSQAALDTILADLEISTPETLETPAKAPKKKRIRKDDDYWKTHVGERKSTRES